ncbi:MAG: formate dehydrogenase accessory sulfurtransferase FdhD [Nitrospirae bacterium]|nr:formate dehydrogenase accessory sulfurtransferase FdhD [Nitrospirota bacterium]MBI5696273.1 formate dehydrogenase accessory sulfurtransferase FdhD [Nitrospirota bacterium]
MDDSVTRRAIHVMDGKGAFEDVGLIVEEPLEIRVNGMPRAVVMRTPGYEMELAAGFCLTEGIVDSYAEIIGLDFCSNVSENAGNVVNVVVDPEYALDIAGGGCGPAGDTLRRDVSRTLPSRSSCGICGVRMLEDLDRRLMPLDAGPEVGMELLVSLQHRMLDHQRLFKTTRGGTHAVAHARMSGELIVVREDVGRHNALDKVIGHAMMEGIDCRDTVVLLSSRISFEMVQKAVRARIPVVAAVSAATTLAVELAGRMGCTLAGRLRERSMTVYTHPERIRGINLA